MACIWEHVCPDGIDSWWESSCGVAGNEPMQGWVFCPFCGEKIKKYSEGAKNTEQQVQPDNSLKPITRDHPGAKALWEDF